jgi:ribose transport system substrate-binding protein
VIFRKRLRPRHAVLLVAAVSLAAGIAWFAAAATIGTAEAAPAARSGALVLGFSSYPPVVPVIASAVSGAKAEAKKLHVQIKFGMAPDAPSQQSAIDQLIAEGVNVLGIDPNDSTAITTSIKQANSKKIPVIMWVGTASGGKVATFIGSDELQGGKNVAEYLARILNGHGQVALIQGDEVHQAFILRERGFRSQLKKHPGLKLVAFGLGKETAPPSEALARDMMTAHPQLNAIVALSDAMAAGVYQAVRAVHKTGSVSVVGYNGDCPTLRSIWNGQIKATVFQNWYGFGSGVVDAAIKVHAGKSLPAKMIEPTVVIDRSLMKSVRAGTYPSKDASLTASVTQAVTNHCPKA